MKINKELFSLKNIFLTIVFIGTLTTCILFSSQIGGVPELNDYGIIYIIQYTINCILLGGISLISFYSLLK